MEDHEMKCACEDCGRHYGHEHGFPDLVISYEAWCQISTNGNDSGLLCPSCICKRLHDKGISTTGAFMSGPIRSVSYELNGALRQLENIELALEGRRNRWGAALDERIAEAKDRPATASPDHEANGVKT